MSRCVFLSGLCCISLAANALALAQQAPSTNPSASASTAAAHATEKPNDRQCIRNSGSALPASKGVCLPVAGRNYSKSDIDQTGETRIGPALGKLDSSITVRH